MKSLYIKKPKRKEEKLYNLNSSIEDEIYWFCTIKFLYQIKIINNYKSK